MLAALLLWAVAWAAITSASCLLVSIAPLAAIELGVSKAFAPFACGAFLLGCTFISVRLASLFASLGQHGGFFIGGIAGILGGSIGTVGVLFRLRGWTVFAAAFLVGMAQGLGQSYRFAALEVCQPSHKPLARTVVLSSGMAAIFAGPPLAILTQELMPDVARKDNTSSTNSSSTNSSSTNSSSDGGGTVNEEGGRMAGAFAAIAALHLLATILSRAACSPPEISNRSSALDGGRVSGVRGGGDGGGGAGSSSSSGSGSSGNGSSSASCSSGSSGSSSRHMMTPPQAALSAREPLLRLEGGAAGPSGDDGNASSGGSHHQCSTPDSQPARTWEQQARKYAAQTSGAGGHEGAPLISSGFGVDFSGYCPLLLSSRRGATTTRRRRCAAATTLGTLAHMARWLLLSPASIAMSDLGFGISTRTLGLELHFVATYTTSLLLASPLLRTLGPVLTAACGSLLLGGACALLLLFDEDAALPNLPSQYVTGMALVGAGWCLCTSSAEALMLEGSTRLREPVGITSAVGGADSTATASARSVGCVQSPEASGDIAACVLSACASLCSGYAYLKFGRASLPLASGCIAGLLLLLAIALRCCCRGAACMGRGGGGEEQGGAEGTSGFGAACGAGRGLGGGVVQPHLSAADSEAEAAWGTGHFIAHLVSPSTPPPPSSATSPYSYASSRPVHRRSSSSASASGHVYAASALLGAAPLHVVNNHFHFHDPMRQSPAGAAGAAGAVGSVGAASGDATRRAEELQPAEALEEQTPAARPASSGAANPLSSPDKDAPVRHFAQAD